jgi:succinate dehydrogenase / fumarate reductase cytochrome b subunit
LPTEILAVNLSSKGESMSGLLRLYRSAVGKKFVMAASGIALFGFVLVHMLGNLKLYQGAEKLNAYAEWLREIGSPVLPHSGMLWIARLVLLAAVGIHMLAATQLTLMSWRARPEDYRERRIIQATYASRTMRWGGVIIFLYVFYHLAHLTWGWNWAHPQFVPGDVYHNVVSGFRVWWVSAFYMAAQVALGFHLYHGLWSMFQSLGWWQRSNPHDWRRRFAQLFAWVITLGNLSFPLAVLAGLVQ